MQVSGLDAKVVSFEVVGDAVGGTRGALVEEVVRVLVEVGLRLAICGSKFKRQMAFFIN